tara:strand:- start:422 stop:952 length:531 start_codon:yes stop_codon:yes gene_type:complete
MALTKVTGAGVGTLDSATITSATITNQLTDANMSAGSVIQVVHNSNASDVALTNDTSTFSTAITADITPRATSSKILILLEGAGDVQNGNYRALYWRILRDSTQIKTMSYHMYNSNEQKHNIDAITLHTLDSPSTTSQITYSIQARHTSGSSTSGTYNGYVNRYNTTRVTLFEIAG